jgi:hypothetical protein
MVGLHLEFNSKERALFSLVAWWRWSVCTIDCLHFSAQQSAAYAFVAFSRDMVIMTKTEFRMAERKSVALKLVIAANIADKRPMIWYPMYS